MRKDLHNNVSPVVALNIGSIGSNTTTAGAIIDTKGYGALEFIIQSGAITDGTFTPLVEEGDESNLSDSAAVSDDNLFGTEAGAAFVAADDNRVKRVGYWVGAKRYVRLSLVSSGVTTGGTLGAIAVRANADHLPTA